MATSGTTVWNLDVSKIIEIAARRARGNQKGALTGVEAQDARTALNLVLTDLTNGDSPLSTLEERTLTIIPGQTLYDLPSDVVDIFDLSYGKYQGDNAEMTYTPVTRISLMDYNRYNTTTTETSFMSQYAVKRGVNNITFYTPQTPDTETENDMLRYWCVTRIQDVTAAAQQVDLSFRFTPPLIAGVAYYMYMEQDGQGQDYEAKLARLKDDYQTQMAVVLGEDRDRSSIYIRPAMGRRR